MCMMQAPTNRRSPEVHRSKKHKKERENTFQQGAFKSRS